jgi:hypothetical protein
MKASVTYSKEYFSVFRNLKLQQFSIVGGNFPAMFNTEHFCLCISLKKKFSILRGRDPVTYIIRKCGSNITGTDLCVNKPHCIGAVRP